MEIPDLEGGYSIANNSINAVMAIIDDCVMKDKFEIPDYVSTQLLKSEILNTCLSLRASDHEKNQEDIAKLIQLYQNVIDKESNAQDSVVEEQQEMAAQQQAMDLSAMQQPMGGQGQEQVELATPQITQEEGV